MWVYIDWDICLDPVVNIYYCNTAGLWYCNGIYNVSQTGPWFNIETPPCQYRKSHYGDKMILRPSYLHNGISHTGKMTSFYWITAQVLVSSKRGFNYPHHINMGKCYKNQIYISALQKNACWASSRRILVKAFCQNLINSTLTWRWHYAAFNCFRLHDDVTVSAVTHVIQNLKAKWVSEWLDLTAFLGTADSEVHIVNISRVTIAYTLESLSSLA